MRFEFWVHSRICICKHRCIPRQRYDLRVRAIILPIQPVSRLFDETISPESSLLNKKKKKKKKKRQKRTDSPRCHALLSYKTCNGRFLISRTTSLFNPHSFVATTNFPRVLLLREKWTMTNKYHSLLFQKQAKRRSQRSPNYFIRHEPITNNNYESLFHFKLQYLLESGNEKWIWTRKGIEKNKEEKEELIKIRRRRNW